MEKSYRIHTSTPSDITLNVNMKQDFDFLEVLSLKLSQEDAYKLHSSNYGVIVGRVLANDAFGVPNAKISVFIERDTNDVSELEKIYPYTEVTSKDKEGRRYNLLPDYSDDDCYRIVGTFPNKRLLLDDVTYIEVYEKYWKYTTVTNQAGDYMIFGVPTGSHQIHTDIDLSDIGILSQKPRDFIYKGYNMTEFDNANQFKESTNLDVLKQIISQDKSTFVYPFWGDADNGIAAITRCDVQVDYKFEPTCIFLGSIVSDNEGNAIGHKCSPSTDNGMNNQLVAGEGTIEMIRKTLDGLVEEYPIQGNRLIDSDGVWCYQIPMNLDYVGTDEYGNIVPTDNPNKGIPTRTQVRFRISKIETGDEGFSRHTAKYLVPINPGLNEQEEIPTFETIKTSSAKDELERLYEFGSSTPQSCFRDLYWNNVYSVKNYIPKIQVASKAYSTYYSALKGSNLVDNQNPIPFNKLRIDIPFMYMIVCILFSIIVVIISIINAGIICTIDAIINIIYQIVGFKLPFIGRPFGRLADAIAKLFIGCISLGAGLSEDNKAYYPGCTCGKGKQYASCPEGMDSNCTKVNDNTELKDKIQQNLALEYKIVKLDLYQDWVNGCLYMPLWYWRKRKKKTFLFGLFSRSAKNEFCDCNKTYSRLKTAVTCNIEYKDNKLGTDNDKLTDKESRWHKNRRDTVRFKNGVIKGVTNKDNLTVYYYTAMQPTASYTENTPTVIRLYATDIILLGNLNEDNLYGIPQFFKVLPSTTANVPAIATIQESTDDSDGGDSQSDVGNSEDSGTTVTTGMDWGANGGDETPTYSTGLFLDLACTYAATKAKSCINVERLSELGVNLDMTYNMSYANGGSDVKTGILNADGFISKTELDDLDNRSAFATLNHIGFVPQAYQDTISGTTTQVEDDNTNYLVPKFKYIFPVDFDGRMQPIMNNYKKTFEQAMFDEYDDAYVTFRMGAESGNKNNNEHRIRHFYNINGEKYSMPLYNNSFYFYFGINKGNTAIDKFNSMFMAECFQNKKDAFGITVSTSGRSACPSIYNDVDNGAGFGRIKVSSDDIVTPFTYTLYDSIGNIVIKESDMSATTFTIGSGNSIVGGVVTYQDGTTADSMYGTMGLTNQVYNLVVTDDNDKTISKRIDLNMPNISLSYSTYKLGTKYYNTTSTKKTYICNSETDLYGRIVIDEVYVDGIKCLFKKPSGGSGGAYFQNVGENEFVISGITVTDDYNIDGNILKDNEVKLIFKVSSLEGDTFEGLCDCTSTSGTVRWEAATADTCSGVLLKEVLNEGETSGITTLQFDVYQPSKYLISASMLCYDKEKGRYEELNENIYSEIVTVHNGENFNTFLNGMPVKFMLGTTNDNATMSVSTTSKFYNTNVVRDLTDSHISGWFGVHQEDSYQFNRGDLQTVEQNRNIWEDFVEVTENMMNPVTKLNILKYKFEKMFSLSDAVYNSYEFRYSSVGGITPILFRTVAPQYSNSNTMFSTYELVDNSMITVPQEYPNIVGNNYKNHNNETKVAFNKLYDHATYIGNYFAAFSNNGGYRNKSALDRKKSVVKIPNYADLSPKGNPKKLGVIETGNIPSEFKTVHTQGNHQIPNSSQQSVKPYLRTLAVDRRLSYDLTVFAPLLGSTFNLYSGTTSSITTDEGTKTIFIPDPRDNYWRNSRINGKIFGGIEMSYDNGNDYFLSAETTSVNAKKIRLDITAVWDNNENKSKRIIQNYITKESVASIDNDITTTDGKDNKKYNTFTLNGTTYYIIDSNTWKDDNGDGHTIGEDGWISKVTDSGFTSATTEYEIFNSIEHNIITADTNTISGADGSITVTSVTSNNLLEYSYEFTNGSCNAITKYNKDPQVKKKFYEFSLAGTDISDYLWSDFNRDIETKPKDGNPASAITPYVFSYPKTKQEYYNGDFNRETVVKNNGYPTRRYIDVTGIPASNSYNLNITSCGYPSQVNFDTTTDVLSCQALQGESVDVGFSFDMPVQFVEPSEGNNTQGNINYKWFGTATGANNKTYSRFVGHYAYLTFKISSKAADGFNVYATCPTVIKVLPYTKGFDGITYLKTACPSGENGFPNRSFKDAIKNVTIYQFNGVKRDVRFFIFNGRGGDAIYPDNLWETSELEWEFVDKYGNRFSLNGRFMTDDENGNEYFTCDNTKFAKLIHCKDFSIDGDNPTKVFTILVTKVYYSTEDDNIMKRIITYEFGDLYDARDILLRMDNEENMGVGSGNCYVTLEEEYYEKYDDQGQLLESGTTKNYYQTLGFSIYTYLSGDPINMSCQVFSDYNNMSFSFVFTHGDNQYVVDGGDVTPVITYIKPDGTQYIPQNPDDEIPSVDKTLSVELFFKAKWTQEMGILGATGSQNRNKWTVSLMAKSSSGFSYRIPFTITCGKQDNLPTSLNEKKATRGISISK